MIPKPAELGLPAAFKEWRPNQWQAIQDGVKCSKRAAVQIQKPGAGKSLTYIAQALLLAGSRVAILTPQNGLVDDLLDKFSELHLASVRGKATYKCEGRPNSNCEEGHQAKCMFKGTSLCSYTFNFNEMAKGAIGVTNYSCWISSYKYGRGFGTYDVLICDEAHNIPDQVANAMRVVFYEREIQEVMKYDFPEFSQRGDIQAWKAWARVASRICESKLEELKSELDATKKPPVALSKQYNKLFNLSRKCADIASCRPEDWVVDTHPYGYQLDPINPAASVERLLFRKTPKLILTSATIDSKCMEFMDLQPDDYEIFTYGSKPKPQRCPIYFIPTTPMNFYSQPWQYRKWMDRIDEIIEPRLHRKGIIHTCNFRLRDYIKAHSAFSRYMLSNYPRGGETTSTLVKMYRDAKPPCIFVSPSVVQGYDLPHDACRWQIVGKLNYAKSTSKIEEARNALDKDRQNYLVWQALRQIIGRGDRDELDWQEVFIVDNAMDNLVNRYGHLTDPEFFIYYQKLYDVPEPLIIEAVA